MTAKALEYAAALRALNKSAMEGAEALVVELSKSAPVPAVGTFDDTPIFDAVRTLYGALDNNEFTAIKRGIQKALGVIVAPAQVGISPEAFEAAARQLEPDNVPHALAAIRAVDEVESGGGWFPDMRAEILALDGPGGFIDGENMPKILFEAHVFARNTGGKFNASHPNVSSAKWNRALYVGGQAEYKRLNAAMALDHDAALKAASWGRYQILGENFAAAGFANVTAFVDAMKESEERQLDAFVAFIVSSKLVDEFRRIGIGKADCTPFAVGYNGSGQAANNYDGKIATAFGRWSKKLKGQTL